MMSRTCNGEESSPQLQWSEKKSWIRCQCDVSKTKSTDMGPSSPEVGEPSGIESNLCDPENEPLETRRR